MLYLYDFDFEMATEEEIKAIENCKDLKRFDDFHYISKSNSVVIDGINKSADYDICYYLGDIWNGNELLSFELSGGKFEIDMDDAVAMFKDNFREDDEEEGEIFDYTNRIYDADEPIEESYKILCETAVRYVNTFVFWLKLDCEGFCKEHSINKDIITIKV